MNPEEECSINIIEDLLEIQNTQEKAAERLKKLISKLVDDHKRKFPKFK